MGLDADLAIRLLEELVSLESVFPREAPALVFIERVLSDWGIPAQRILVSEERWNLLARVGSGDPVVCLCAHADTVPPSGKSIPKARREGDRIGGLGACDDKASIAAMMSALRMLRDGGLPSGSVDLLISVDEEATGLGVRTAVSQGYRCDYAIVGEPTSLQIVAGHGGLLLLELETRGVAAHGSSPWLGINAIEEMRTLLEQIRSDLEHAVVHPRLGRPSLNLGAIRAGDAPNRVPDRCTALVDIRVVPPMTASGVMTTLENLLTQERWKSSSVKVIKIGEPFEAAADSLLVSALCEAGKSVLGATPEIAWKRYWTEADPLRNDLGADVVVFGPGNGEQAHSADEFVEISQLLAAAEIYERVARWLASPTPR